jgi:hypothetical protein
VNIYKNSLSNKENNEKFDKEKFESEKWKRKKIKGIIHCYHINY